MAKRIIAGLLLALGLLTALSYGGGNYGSSRQSAPARNDAPAGGSSFAEFDDGEGELPF